MTIKTNFQTGSYYAADLVNEFAALFTDGVLNTTVGSLLVSALGTPNLSVNVAIGSCMKAGLFLNSNAIANVVIVANTSGYNRIDVIAADLDNNIMVAVQGTPSSSPTAPVLTGNKIALAQVLAGNNVSVINTGNITDVRVNVDLFASQLAGLTNTALLAANGWFKDKKTGLIIQWGHGTAVQSTNTSFTLPLTFPNALLWAGCVAADIGLTNISVHIGSCTTSMLSVNNQNTSGYTAYWLAIGY